MDAFRQKIADQIERQKEIKKEQMENTIRRTLQIYSWFPKNSFSSNLHNIVDMYSLPHDGEDCQLDNLLLTKV